MSVLATAFKEWAAVCKALADGRQALILRKGGIAESGGEFRPDNPRFWLYPTFFHEHQAGVRPEAQPLIEQAEADRPTVGTIALGYFADVAGVEFIRDLDTLRRLAPFHVWTDDVVTQRFHYRTPGVFALTVRVSRVPSAVEVLERPEYAGCKSWVTFEPGVPTDGATPVLDDAAFDDAAGRIRTAIRG